MTKRQFTLTAISLAALPLVPIPAHADDISAIVPAPCGGFHCSVDSDGADLGLTKGQTAALSPKTGSGGTIGTTKYVPGTKYRYDTKFRCPTNFPGREQTSCAQSIGGCKNVNNAGTGDVYRIWRRVEVDDKTRGTWEIVGITCWPELVPGSNKPRLTLAMIEHEWSLTPFAKPQLSIQPVKNRTLVTLPTYFKLRWPELGYQPGEERTLTLLGRTIKIRPTLKTNTYNYGDGTSSGPTTSLGGTWPEGDIRHSYKNPGKFQTTVATTYGGQYSLDGGPWNDLPAPPPSPARANPSRSSPPPITSTDGSRRSQQQPCMHQPGMHQPATM